MHAAHAMIFGRSALIAIALLGAHATAADAQSYLGRDYYFGRTTDRTPVEVTLRDEEKIVRFRIPKSYLTFSENWKGGPQKFIVLDAIYPSMSALSETRASASGPDVVTITVVSTADPKKLPRTKGTYKVPNVIDRMKKTQWIPVGRYESDFSIYIFDTDRIEQWANRRAMIKEVLVSNDNDVYFSCLREEGNANVGCTGYANIADNLTIEFQFRRSEFGNWRNIRDASLRLLESFKIPSAE